MNIIRRLIAHLRGADCKARGIQIYTLLDGTAGRFMSMSISGGEAFTECNVPSVMLSTEVHENTNRQVSWAQLHQDPVFMSFFPHRTESTLGGTVNLSHLMNPRMLSGSTAKRTAEEGFIREPMHGGDLKTCSSSGLSSYEGVQSGDLLLTDSAGRNPEQRRGRQRGVSYRFSATSNNIHDVDQFTRNHISVGEHGGEKEEQLVVDEVVQGLVLQAVVAAMERTTVDSEGTAGNDMLSSGCNAFEGEEEAEETLFLNLSDETPTAFTGKRGVVFGYWSKTPYG
ncbi:hypothetical protein CEUSTIGMA_g10962.t1 [Chlamydomonas eustigma]|uniref:Uncharacterized protein n=1 Tax=Chlamydomonas eustigma TaxID=1157962 RepID=A0A250XKF9_9CHLO|nr:hypothetical protein CEUSTIGMA_g10962.t1 [Chlamydomonas eustigma]|eukprot:GAX83537.1 hypothetical protein CEUSTIGMA_g10962.t1 [Chlamydomonas eustigma]